MPNPKRILVVTDFSACADAALAYAVELAKALGSKVMLLHTYELPVYDYPTAMVVATPQMVDAILSAADEALAACCDAHAESHVEITKVLRQGVAWDEINRVAQEVSADLIVVGTHGRQGIKRAVLGSVAEKVVRTSTKPVLTVHAAK